MLIKQRVQFGIYVIQQMTATEEKPNIGKIFNIGFSLINHHGPDENPKALPHDCFVFHELE